MDNTNKNKLEIINDISFNQDNTCFSVSTDTGFNIYNTYPFKKLLTRTIKGGVNKLAIISNSSIVALVKKFLDENDKNKIILYDYKLQKQLIELRVNSPVLNLILKRDRIFVICKNEIHSFAFGSFDNINSIQTCTNPKGLFGIYGENDNITIFYPDDPIGNISIKDYQKNKVTSFKAHRSSIACISINNTGTLIATASEKGTLIRIYDLSGLLLQELRRGTQYANIYSIEFDKNDKYLVCSSDTGTIHIFCLSISSDGNNVNNPNQNQTSMIGKIYGMFGFKNEYLNSEWSFSQFNIPNYNSGFSICVFGLDNTLVVLTQSGKYYQIQFNPSTQGKCIKLQEHEINN